MQIPPVEKRYKRLQEAEERIEIAEQNIVGQGEAIRLLNDPKPKPKPKPKLKKRSRKRK